MRILGVEGTAWNAGAAVFTDSGGIQSNHSNPYRPEQGGIHPRDASEHISNELPGLIHEALEGVDSVDAVAFSRGPGLGPCLRVTATAARATALRHDVPLVGVNHTLAHIEMGRFLSGFDDPLALDAAGANTLISVFMGDGYRVVGETMDTGVGNALDKFARHAGLSHPGGPKIEELALNAGGDSYVELPYTVKGMDFSFSGIVNAAQRKLDGGEDLSAVAYSLQENVFGMLTEVSERALALTGKSELVVGGGVCCNARLREMLSDMCVSRGVEFFAPPAEFLSDNAAMIAVTGGLMLGAGQVLDVKDSGVLPDWRPDEVEIGWREEVNHASDPRGMTWGFRGAEAEVEIGNGVAYKRRKPKSYRSRALDDLVRRKRTSSEARLTSSARRNAGVATPVVLDVDLGEFVLEFEYLNGDELLVVDGLDGYRGVGYALSSMHREGIVHGDPTPRNILLCDGDVYFIDFGLAFKSRDIEDFGVDIHVFERSLAGTSNSSEQCMELFWDGYSWERAEEVREQLDEIRGRGRYL